MVDKKTRQVVQEAKRLLAQYNYDTAHDLAHHESVYATAREISQHISEPYDPDVLQIACMWHDVITREYSDDARHKDITHDTAMYLKDFMLQTGFAEEAAEAAYLAVKHHEFDDKPVNTEGKILFDADKLDTLNLDRARRFIASDRMGQIPKWKVKAYVRAVTTMVKLTRSKLHFRHSKALFDQAINQLWDDREVAHYAQKYGVDLDDIKKSLRKTTWLDRFFTLLRR